MSRVPGVAVALLFLAACTAETTPRPAAPPAPLAPQPAAPANQGPARQPLVVALHPRQSPLDLTAEEVRRLAGRRPVVRDPGALRRLSPDQRELAPAHLVGPHLRVATVDGVHPLREPGRYPVRTTGPVAGPVITLTVVGDLMLGRRVGARSAATGDPAHPLRPLGARLAAADITVGNLEGTLSQTGRPTQGGDSFAADPRVVTGLRAAGFDALGLANNHLGDFGDRALVETVDRLRAAGLPSFGAGPDLARSRAPVVIERHGLRFGFLGFNAIGETPEAGPGRPGALSVSMPPRTGPLDRAELRRVLGDVRRLARHADVVTVLPHWGTQYTNRPEPVQARVARALVRAGADLVVGGHPHWVQGAALVGRPPSLVVHSLGNFVFDMDFMRETREGLLLEATFWGDRLMAAELVPYRIGPDFAPRLLPYRNAGHVLGLFWEFSRLGATPR